MELKLFPHMSGIWEGTYTRLAPDGTVMFKHKSRLSLRLDGNEWRQSNYYEFDNGRTEFHNFGMSPFDGQGVMQYDNQRIVGQAWEANGGKNILLWWSYKQEPGTMLYEMITPISNTHRTRVWQHTRNGVFEGLTMIEEWKKAGQEEIPMAHYEQQSYIKEEAVVS
jgi:hypothetical protein